MDSKTSSNDSPNDSSLGALWINIDRPGASLAGVFTCPSCGEKHKIEGLYNVRKREEKRPDYILQERSNG